MKLWLFLIGIFILAPNYAKAENDKIDPNSFICAEFLAISSISGKLPEFESLQIDGYSAASSGANIADPLSMGLIAEEVSLYCEKKPSEVILPFWKKLRTSIPLPKEGKWDAEKATCKDFIDDEDTGSGFVVWLDGYNRQKSNNTSSILENNTIFNDYLNSCRIKPEEKMLDLMREILKK